METAEQETNETTDNQPPIDPSVDQALDKSVVYHYFISFFIDRPGMLPGFGNCIARMYCPIDGDMIRPLEEILPQRHNWHEGHKMSICSFKHLKTEYRDSE